MATSRISVNTNLSSNTREQRQAQARIRALQRRANTLYDDLSRSSFVAKTTAHDFKKAYTTITNEFRDQRDQLLQRFRHVNHGIEESTTELDHIQKSLHAFQSFPLLQRSSSDFEIHQINDTIDNLDHTLNKIAQQLKSFRFMPSNDPVLNKTIGLKHIKDLHRKDMKLTSISSSSNPYHSTSELSVCRLYTVDIDISPQWVSSSIDKRIFLCDIEGEVRVFSYSRYLRRQPLSIEHFRLATSRLVKSFTVTQDYLVAFENDTQTLTLHTHHGGILLRLSFLYDPIMMVRCNYLKTNRIWTCSHSKRQCYQFHLDHTMKKVEVLDEIDLTEPIAHSFVDPIGVSTDEQNRLAIHDVSTTDRIVLVTNHQSTVLSLDFIRYLSDLSSARIERVLLVPNQSHLLLIVYTSKLSLTSHREILLVDIRSQPAQILYRLSEIHGIQSIDITLDSELIYTTPAQKTRRMSAKMHIYSLFD